MSTLLEILVTCDSNNTLWSCCVWDPNTGSSLMTYKGVTIKEKTLSFIGQDYVAGVDKTKPILHIWPINSHQTVQGMHFILPGKANAFAVSCDGLYCVAAIDEKIYLWQIASGDLIAIISSHFRRVVILKFTSDGRFFISAAEDGMIMVWSLAQVSAHKSLDIIPQSVVGRHDPMFIFSDHYGQITDLYISKTGIQGRLVTVSNDKSCHIYDLSAGQKLLSKSFDVELTAVTMDVLELTVFVGTSEGKIIKFSLSDPVSIRNMLIDSNDMENVYLSHNKAVTCLSVSQNGRILMSGSNDEQVVLWEIHSKQAIRTIQHKGPITNAFFSVNYPAIFKHDFSPSVVLHSLEKVLDQEDNQTPRDEVEIDVLVNKSIENFWPEHKILDYDASNTSRKQTERTEHLSKQRENELIAEIEKLKKMNKCLYSKTVQDSFDTVSNCDNKNKKKRKRQR